MYARLHDTRESNIQESSLDAVATFTARLARMSLSSSRDQQNPNTNESQKKKKKAYERTSFALFIDIIASRDTNMKPSQLRGIKRAPRRPRELYPLRTPVANPRLDDQLDSAATLRVYIYEQRAPGIGLTP